MPLDKEDQLGFSPFNQFSHHYDIDDTNYLFEYPLK